MKRFHYWYTDNYQTPQCPSGMAESPVGDYVRFEDVEELIEAKNILDEYNALAKRVGFADIESFITNALVAQGHDEELEDDELEHTGD